MIGKKLSPILSEIEDTILEFEVNVGSKQNYTEEGFKAGVKIFSTVILDKMWELQSDEGINMNIRIDMAQKAGEDILKLIKTL